MNPPLLRKGSAVTPSMLLDDKLYILEWELNRGFITAKDLLDTITPHQLSLPDSDLVAVDGLFNALRELKGVSR